MNNAAAATLYACTSTGLLLIYWGAAQSGIPFADLSRDPLAVCGGRPFDGALSNLGVLLWCAAATLCLMAAAVMHRAGREQGFYLCSGLLTVMLLVDDLFQLHEVVLPGSFSVRQRYVLLTYLLLAAAYLARYRRRILANDWGFMAAALAFFSISLIADTLQAPTVGLTGGDGTSLGSLIEDGSKLLGIISWLAFYASQALGDLRPWDNKPAL